MRSLVPILLMVLAAALPGCAGNQLPAGSVPTNSYAETGNGQAFMMTKLIGGPSGDIREGCGGR
jgi:hypothetical protein